MPFTRRELGYDDQDYNSNYNGNSNNNNDNDSDDNDKSCNEITINYHNNDDDLVCTSDARCAVDNP